MAAARTPRKKFTGNVASDFDPNLANTNRTFELLIMTPLSEGVFQRKLRIRVTKGSLEDNVFVLGQDVQCYVGLISEQTGAARGPKWTGYNWGHVPLKLLAGDYSFGYAREIFPELEAPAKEPKPEHEKDKPDGGD